MEYILFFSLFCKHSNNILQYIQCLPELKDSIRFVNLDKRYEKNGTLYVVLDNGKHMEIPKIVRSVPTMILLHNGNQILTSEDQIKSYLEKKSSVSSMRMGGEPESFSLGMGSSDICSDSYSFFDMDSESLSAKGEGGLRQMHNYVSLNDNIRIETPPDDAPKGNTENALKEKEKEREAF